MSAGAALAYAARGWPVFPLRPRAKVPLIPKEKGGNGVHDATTDPDRIHAWWAACPEANIGLAAGHAFWVLDVDYGGWTALERDGADTIAALQRRFGRLPETVTSLTGGGGWQYLFAADSRLNNGVKALAGIDTRSHGGYIVAPPSIHPSGRAYRWRRDHEPDEIEIATAPAWLIALLEPVELPAIDVLHQAARGVADLGRYAAAALDRACTAIRTAPFGCQCDTLERQAFGIGRLVAGGVIPRSAAYAALVTAGCQMANAPRRRRWTATEIEARIARALRQAEQQPRTPGQR